MIRVFAVPKSIAMSLVRKLNRPMVFLIGGITKPFML